jgi:cytochrome c oxidase subunit 2
MKKEAKIINIFVIFFTIFSPIILGNSLPVMAEEQVSESKEIHLYAEKYEFTPNKITIPYGTNLTLILHAKDRIHGFFLEGYDITQTMCNEHDFTITFMTNKIGTFIFKCNEPACGPYHPYMVGSITVTPNNQLTTQYVVIAIAFIIITVVFINQRRKSSGF